MNRWTKSAAMFLLGAALAQAQAQEGERGRGADYGNYGERSRSDSPKRGSDRERGEAVRPRQESPSSGRQDEALNRRIAGWEGGYRSDDRGNRFGSQGTYRGQRDDYVRREYRPGRNDPQARHFNDHDWRGHGGDYRDYGRDRRDWHEPHWRKSWNHGWNGHRYRAPVRYIYPRGYASNSWRVGYHVPSVFLRADYYVDYRPYRLAPPPYGCRWVRIDGDLLLIELVSGEIIDALFEFFYY